MAFDMDTRHVHDNDEPQKNQGGGEHLQNEVKPIDVSCNYDPYKGTTGGAERSASSIVSGDHKKDHRDTYKGEDVQVQKPAPSHTSGNENSSSGSSAGGHIIYKEETRSDAPTFGSASGERTTASFDMPTGMMGQKRDDSHYTKSEPAGALSSDKGSVSGQIKSESGERIFGSDRAGLTYRHVSDSIKDTGKRILTAPAEAFKNQADPYAENSSEGYSRTKDKVSEAGDIITSIGNVGRRDEIIRALDKETSRYVAGDMFFSNGLKPGIISTYVMEAKAQGVYEGYTVGVDRAFRDVCAHPEEYFKPGTITIDENKVMDKINRSERFQMDDAGNVLRNDKGDALYDVPQNCKWRKKAEKTYAYRDINDLEAKMKDFSGKGIFSASEEKMLGENNRIFTFKNISDIDRTAGIVDKYLLEQIRFAGIDEGDVLKIFGGTLQNKEVSLKMLRKMSSKDVRRLLKKIDGMAASGAIVEALKAKHMLTMSSEKIKKLGNITNISKTGFMMLAGGDEFMQSEAGQSITYVRRGVKVGTTAAKTGYKAGKLVLNGGVKVGVKAADLIAPDKTSAVRAFQKNRAVKKAERAAKRTEFVQNLRPVKAINTVRNNFASGLRAVGDAYRRTTIGKITGTVGKYGGRVFSKISAVIKKPFQLISQTTNFIKRKIILPIAIGFGGLMIIFYILASMGGGGTGSASAVFSTILSEDDQFKDYQTTYDACDAVFQGQVAAIVNGMAQTTNLKGQPIPYGINSQDKTQGDISLSGEYKNGIFMNYFYDGASTNGISSNVEDCLSAMTVIMQQAQSEHHTEALELLDALYKSTHSYTTQESALYPCSGGCEITHYNCNEWQLNYPNSELRFQPWLFTELYVPDSSHECVVCRANGVPYEEYAGCTVTGTCYHGDGGDMGRSHSGCDNYVAVYDCPGHEHSSTDAEGNTSSWTSYCSSEIGCDGYYKCQGHDHYGCPNGHEAAACYGHVDLTMNVYIASLNKIFDLGGVPVNEKPGTEPETEAATEGGGADE